MLILKMLNFFPAGDTAPPLLTIILSPGCIRRRIWNGQKYIKFNYK
jgi:hypothetical protein